MSWVKLLNRVSSARIGLRLSLVRKTQSEKGKEPTDMIENLDQVFNEDVLPEEPQSGQNERIAWDSNQRLRDVKHPVLWMLRKVASPEQSTFQQVGACAARGWHRLVSYRFVAPNERKTPVYGAPKKSHVFPRGAKHRPERGFEA